ncbi:MAG: arginine--tRNA ligase [Rhodospirillaceae bacterium]|jgi:arginyl-tRNA synthetase|nr:arginine--tRNA ligase [Rhodospirillaceae bacterium]MBT6116561.1 arginine--tRNA ligase [Rhodospirillaceae bacterium]
MNVFNEFKKIVNVEIEDMVASGDLPSGLDLSRIAVEPPRDPSHGDLSTNAAMVLAKPAGRKPRDIADLLAARLATRDEVMGAEVAGPGFVNLRLASSVWYARLAEALRAGPAYGDSALGVGKRVNVEYVSANPTGPLHVGHARGAVVGDALAALLEKAGYAVDREYYINDAGAQVDQLAASAFLRYLEALGEPATDETFARFCPGQEWAYRGDYLVPVGQALAAAEGERLRDLAPEDWLPPVRAFAIAAMMDLIREDLDSLGIRHALFSSERALVEAGRVDEALADLEVRGFVYTGVLEPPKGKAPEDWEPRPQTLFRSTEFGDDVDRPLKKSDGSWTYFASDIAYHFDKYKRGFADMIDVWGADHGGYVKRMKAAVQAITGGEGALDVKLCQMVNLLEDGQPAKMSKRAGTFVTLREVVDRVGKDVVRFMMVTRKNDAQLDFDLIKVTEQSLENPVFYVQYGHARAHSALRNAAETFPDLDSGREALAEADLGGLTDPDELGLIKLIAGWPRQVELAAEAHEPHRLAFYLGDLVSAFHSLWSRGNKETDLRFILPEDPSLTAARLALVRGVALVIASGLAVFGVEPVEEMR